MTKLTRNASANFGAMGDGSLAYVDMLRGLAILGVLLVHSTVGMAAAGLETLTMHLEYLLIAGRHGVTLFFVVSAFTLMRSMHIRNPEEKMPMRKYFLRRFFRIAPAYYFILIIVFFYGMGSPTYSNPQNSTLTWPDLATHMLFVNGLFPYYANDFLGVEWSVSTEFMFYMLLPFCFLWLNNVLTARQAMIKVGFLYLATVVIGAGWIFVCKSGYLHVIGGGFASPVFRAWSYFFIVANLHAFVAGVAIWAVIHFKVRNHDCQQASNKLSLAGLVCIAIAGAYAEGYKLSDSTMVLGGMFFLWGLLSAALIYVLNFLQPVNMAGLRGLAGLGKVSFSLYLVHIPICSGLSRYPNIWSLTQTPEVNFLLYLVMVLGLSYLLARMLFYFVENPGIELGRILIMRLSTQ